MARWPKGSANNTGIGSRQGSLGPSKNPSVITGGDKGKILATGFSLPTDVPAMPTEIFNNNTFQTQKWQPFGSDNLFPQAIAQLTRKSPTLRGILNWKTIYCSGKGFITEKNDTKLIEYISNVNADSESLISICRKLFFDRFSGGNCYIEIVKKGDVVNIYHRDHTTCRLSFDKKSILIYGNWTQISSAKPEDIKSIPLYPVFEDTEKDGYMRSIYHYKSYEPEFSNYGLPDMIAGMDAAGICYKTNKWNVSRLDNSFNSSGTLVVEGNITPKQAKQMKADFKKEFSGENKQGKIMFIVKSLGGGETKFTPISNSSEGDWLSLHKQADQDLIISCNWFRSLSGLAEPGALGNTQQIRNEYQIASNTVIPHEQEGMLEVMKKIIKEQKGIDISDLKFVNEAPIDMYDIDINAIMTIGEARKRRGLQVDDTDEKMKMYISENQLKKESKTTSNG